MPRTYSNTGGGSSNLPEPPIRNVEVWLDWQACLMDTPHWWEELTTIPKVEDPKKLVQKIHAFFLIPAVRCETFPGQVYTVPPAPKCLTNGRFIPNNPSYQDIWQQPLLVTVAYAQALQYWVEQVRLPVYPDYHSLVMSILEWQVRGHITFYKWDIFWNLEKVAPETVDRYLVTPQGYPITQPTPINVGGRRSGSVGAPGECSTTPSQPTEEAPPSQIDSFAYHGWCWPYTT